MSLFGYTVDEAGLPHSINDAPSRTWSDGEQVWHWHGKRHRDKDDQPAHICRNARIWYRFGELHRVTGPAIEEGDERVWCLFGVAISKYTHRRLVELPTRWRRRHALRMRPHWLCALDAHLVPDVARLVVDTFLIP